MNVKSAKNLRLVTCNRVGIGAAEKFDFKRGQTVGFDDLLMDFDIFNFHRSTSIGFIRKVIFIK